MPSLILKRASASRSSGEWSDDDYDVLAQRGPTADGRVQMNWRFAIAVLFAPTATHVQIAIENSSGYNCTVKDFRTLQQDGTTQPRSAAGISRFTVDRASGRILGDLSSQVWKHQVLDPGSNRQSYKTLYVSSGGFVHIRLLQVMEFESGPVKSFLFVDGPWVFSGTCTHLR
jgi:hypothetical protein